MKARIRELLRVVPFQPFIIRMGDGLEYRIEHPDFVWPLRATCLRLRSKSATVVSTIFQRCLLRALNMYLELLPTPPPMRVHLASVKFRVS